LNPLIILQLNLTGYWRVGERGGVPQHQQGAAAAFAVVRRTRHPGRLLQTSNCLHIAQSHFEAAHELPGIAASDSNHC